MGELLTCLKVLINKLWCNKLINNDFTSRWDPDFCTVIAVPFFLNPETKSSCAFVFFEECIISNICLFKKKKKI